MRGLQLDEQLDLEADTDIDLPDLSRIGKLNMEYDALSLSTEDHIMAILRQSLAERGILNNRDLDDLATGSMIRCAGLVVIRQAPPTAKGFRFLTLEDEFGFINVIVRPQIYETYRRIIRSEQLLVVRGEVQRERAVVNVLAQHLSHFIQAH